MTDAARRLAWRSLAVGVLFVACLVVVGQFRLRPDQRSVLNALRADINATYGDMRGTPRINCGPCTRFALAFREEWKARFGDELNLVCVLSPDKSECGHVALKLPDGSYFDGGNGVMSPQQLMRMFPSYSVEEMVPFDLERLDRLVGGIHHEHYQHCPGYSDELTASIIEKHLSRLPGG